MWVVVFPGRYLTAVHRVTNRPPKQSLTHQSKALIREVVLMGPGAWGAGQESGVAGNQGANQSHILYL